jgi:hypothetical protein
MMGANSEFIKTARPTGFPFMPNSNIQERVTMVCGESIVIYSGDNRRWFSDRSEAERAHRAHVEFVESMKRSLARWATFAIRAATPRGRTSYNGRRRRSANGYASWFRAV